MRIDAVADAGNSFIKWGRCSDGAVIDMVRLGPEDTEAWVATLRRWGVEEKCQWAVAGSEPSLRQRLARWLQQQNQRVHMLDSYTQLPISLNVKHPDKVGLDRLFNAVAVKTCRSPDRAAVVIDAGTAITVDYVNEAGVFQGGAILPGLALMAELLHKHTATLPLIKSEEVLGLGASLMLPGKSTAEAIALGIGYCCRGGVECIAREYLKITNDRATTYIGGGDGPWLDASFSLGEHHLWPEMTLEGIRIAAEQLP